MANLSREKVAEIIKNAPTGTTPQGIVSALRQKGHILEGYPLDVPQQPKTLQDNLVETFKGGTAKADAIRTKVEEGKISPLSGTLQTIGTGVATAGNLGTDVVMNFIPEPIKKRFTEDMKKSYENMSPENKKIWADRAAKVKSFTDKNPEAAGNIEAVVELLSIIPVTKGFKVAGEGVEAGFKAAGSQLVKRAENKALQSGVKELEGVTELVMEKAKKQNVITAAMEGRATQSGKVKSFDILPSPRDTQIAKDVLSVSKSGRNVAETLSDINKAIPEISEKEVRPFLRANPRAFNVQTVNSRLNAIEMPDLFKTDASLEKTYNLVRQRMVQVIEKHPKTTEGLWDARKEFDKIVKEQFGDAAFDSEKNTAIKRAVQDMRREVNNFIGEEIGDGTFKAQMSKLSNLYEAQYNLGEKFYDLRNTNAFKRWAKENPLKAKAVGITVGGTITGTILNKIFGN